MPNIKLQSSDGQEFIVDVEVAKKSRTIKDMLENISSDDNADEAVPIMKVRGGILEKIIEWSEYHINDDDPDDPNENKDSLDFPLPSDDICEWDLNFMDVDMSIKFELLLAANYLHVKGLMVLVSKSIANKLKGKSPEEMRLILNVPSKEVPQGPTSSHDS